MKEQGVLYLFPCPISDNAIETLPHQTMKALFATRHFLVERAKTARHFLKDAGHPIPISQMIIQEITQEGKEDISFLEQLLEGTDIGLLSEAGCPGIADPGSLAVQWAHKNQIRVRPMVGPSSILLAMMASGLNGQSFAFNGYLPNKPAELVREIKALEAKALKTGQSQIFMEAPYRNEFLLKHLISTLQPSTRLCVACDVNSETESICQKTTAQWKEEKLEQYHRRPCIFILG